MKNIFTTLFFILIFLCLRTPTNAQCQISTANSTSVSCPGVCDGSILLVSTGGTLPYTVIHPVTSIPITYTSAVPITGLCAGTYTLNINDASGTCNETLVVTVSQPAPLTFSVQTMDETVLLSCDGSANVIINGGTPPYNITWYNSSMQVIQTGTATTIIMLCSGNYYVEVTDNNGCAGIGPSGNTLTQFSIFFQSVPCQISTESVTPVSCYGACDGSITINSFGGSPPYTVIDPNNGSAVSFTSSVTLTGLCAGNYTLEINDLSGMCPEFDFVVVSQPSQISINPSISNETSIGACDGNITVTATGGAGNFTYSIDGGLTFQAGNTFNSLCAGTYSICVQDGGGCLQCTTVTVGSVNCTTLSSSIIQNVPASCNGICDGMVLIGTNGGTLPYSLQLNSNIYSYTSVVTVPGLCAGTYNGLITDALGCTNNISFSISEPPVVVVDVVGTNPTSASNCDGSATINSISGGTSPYTYTWILCNGLVLGQFNSTATNLCEDDYALVVNDANGCADTSNCITLTASGCNMSSIIQSQNNVSCNGECDGLVILNTTGGTPPYTTTDPSGNTIQYSSIVTIFPLCAGVYTFLITDATGCMNTIVTTVTEPPAITTNITGTAGAGCTGSLSSTVSGGTPGYIYNWINCTTGNSIATTQNVSNVCDGMYMLIITDANGCVDSTSCHTLNSGPCNMTSNAQTQFNATCNGACDGMVLITTINGMPPYTATDQNGNSIQYSSVGTVYPLCAGFYVFTVTDVVGCINTVTAIVTEPSSIFISTSSTNPSSSTACDGTLTGNATGGTGILESVWINCANGDTVSTNQSVTNVCEGSYSLVVTDVNGCTDSTACTTLSAPTGLNEDKISPIKVYPNPVNEILVINGENSRIYAIEIVNLIGEIVFVSNNLMSTYTTINLKMENIVRGTYFVKIKSEKGIFVEKIMVATR